jgi:predicted MFS family arabinose efflux permease
VVSVPPISALSRGWVSAGCLEPVGEQVRGAGLLPESGEVPRFGPDLQTHPVNQRNCSAVLVPAVTVHTPASSRLPFVVYVLMLGAFLMNTTEFMIAGLLPEMASDFGVSVSTTGLLITAFAAGMIVGAPVMALATLRLPRRVTLVLALAVFAAGHAIAALSSSFEVVLGARVLTALVTGMFWAVAAVVTTTAAGPAAGSKALGVLGSGTALATIVGVPLGSVAGQLVGWRGAFWALSVLAVLAAVVMVRLVPAEERRQTPSIRSEIAALRTGRLWLVLGAAVLATAGWMAAYSFISPLLTDHAGISAALVPLVLVGFGAGCLVGTNLSGRFADRHPIGTFIVAALLSTLVLLLIVAVSGSPVVAVILVVLLGVASLAVPPVVMGLSVRYASGAPTFAAALSVSAFNVGIALGSWLGGRALESSLGATGPALIGAVSAALTLLPLVTLARAGKRISRQEVITQERTAVAHPREDVATELEPALARTAC